MLGDFANGCQDMDPNDPDFFPDFYTSVPFRIRDENRSEPELDLLRRGVLPVTWEPYPYYGREPAYGFVNRRANPQVVRFPIPGSEEQAASFLEMHATTRPTLREDKGRCHNCMEVHRDILTPCAECGLVEYCSERCRREHSRFHKRICP